MSLKSNFGKKLMAEKRPCDSNFIFYSKQLLILAVAGIVIYDLSISALPSSAYGAGGYNADVLLIIVGLLMAVIVVFEFLRGAYRMMKKGSAESI